MKFIKKTPLFKGVLAAASLMTMLGLSVVLDTDTLNSPQSYIPVSYPQIAVEKEYTLLIYMVGSDLESASRAASDNLNELKKLSTDNINIVCEAGGSYKWYTEGIYPENSTRMHIENGEIIIDSTVTAKNMGLSSTLADFIVYARESFPSEKVILSLWNHGDGPVGGFGYDELFSGDELLLNELNAAFKAADCVENPIDIIGFDACCMASIETALILEPYASYMVASQEIEPAGGWDYTVMDKLSSLEPSESATKIANAYFEKASKDFSATTVSVTNLTLLNPLRQSIEQIAASLTELGYESFSKLRAIMSGFGGAGRSQGKSDLVDLQSFFNTLQYAGIETINAQNQLQNVVVLTQSGDTQASGLNIYAPYSELALAADKLARYKNANILSNYTSYSLGFANYILTKQLEYLQPVSAQYGENSVTVSENNENIKSAYVTVWEKDNTQEGYYYMTGTDSSVIYEDGNYTYYIDEEWTFLGGQPLCTLELEGDYGIYTRFACPILLNEERANLILQYDRENPYGKVLYAVMLNEDDRLSKLVTPLFGEEKITPLYPVEAFGDTSEDEVSEYISSTKNFKQGESFIYSIEMQLEALPAHEEALYGFWFTTYQNKEYYSDFLKAA